jgi:Protein phosphatase 2C
MGARDENDRVYGAGGPDREAASGQPSGGGPDPRPGPGPAAGPDAAAEPVLLSLYSEKRAGRGEDCEPVARRINSTTWAAWVCDGLGGAGATPVQTVAGVYTSAYVASRLVGETVGTVLTDFVASKVPQPVAGGDARKEPGEWLRDRLAERLRCELRAYYDQAGLGSGRIRGGTIRPLPTTLALGLVRAVGGDRLEVDVMWAGDSRIYLLQPDRGLRQVTIDDLKSGGDAMRNLHDDAPMSNLLSADGNFTVNFSHLSVQAPVVVIAATDGCFGYLSTPAHFEALLLDAMRTALSRSREAVGRRDADAWALWRDELQARIVEVTGDDATLGAICLGWPDFATMAARFADRRRRIETAVARVDVLADKHVRASKAAETAKHEHLRAESELWADYRVGYEELQRRIVPEPAHPPAPAPGVEPARSPDSARPAEPARPAAAGAAGVPAPKPAGAAYPVAAAATGPAGPGPHAEPGSPAGSAAPAGGEPGDLTALMDDTRSDGKQSWLPLKRNKP